MIDTLVSLLELLKKVDRKTLLIIVFSIPLIMVGYYRYIDITSKLTDIDKGMNLIQDNLRKQNQANEDIKRYMDSSIKSLKIDIIESVGGQLKYQLIYQNRLNQKAIIDQLELWVKYNAKYGQVIDRYKNYSDSLLFRF